MCSRIRELREDRNLSQSELAEVLFITQSGYSKYEVGKSDMPTAVLVALAKYYRTSVDYLLGLTREKTPYPKERE